MQKTAYDMRISDWSSDVCSSDLVAAVLSLVEGQLGDAVALVDDHVLRRQMVQGQGLHVVHAAFAVAQAEHQIGRASGRERVCQYGEYPVVAEPTQKKSKSQDKEDLPQTKTQLTT